MEHNEKSLLHSIFPQYDEDIIQIILETYKDVSTCIDKLNDMEKEYDIALMNKNYVRIKKKSKCKKDKYDETQDEDDELLDITLNNKVDNKVSNKILMDDIKLTFKERLYNVLPQINRQAKYKQLTNDIELISMDK